MESPRLRMTEIARIVRMTMNGLIAIRKIHFLSSFHYFNCHGARGFAASIACIDEEVAQGAENVLPLSDNTVFI
jgi:hypothetical protein